MSQASRIRPTEFRNIFGYFEISGGFGGVRSISRHVMEQVAAAASLEFGDKIPKALESGLDKHPG